MCELLADTGNRQRALPYAEKTIKALEDAYAGLAESREITPDNYAILAASVQLDLARLRTKGINPAGTTEDEANAATKLHADLAREHLERGKSRGAGWWNQKLRLDGHDLLMRGRQVRDS